MSTNKRMSNHKKIFTIGYAGYRENINGFLNDLIKNNINVLIDVRSSPYSAQFPEFNKEVFGKYLANKNIIYGNYPDEFGAKQTDSKYYSELDDDGLKIDYDKFVRSDKFITGVEKLNKIYSTNHIVAIMCSEKDPAACHRAIMIGKSLCNDHGFEVVHIEFDQPNETQKQLEERIKKELQEKIPHKKKLNKIEEKLKHELQLKVQPSLIEQPDLNYIDNISNYYRIINSTIGWKLSDVLGNYKYE